MGNVIVTYRAMPTSVDVNMDELEQRVKEKVNPESVKREPIAFGLVALNVTVVIPDAGGELDRVQDMLKSIEGISEIEVTELTKSL